MLHEVILALSGCPGSIFVMNEKFDIRLVPDLPFISRTEEELLNRLCELGSYYYRFQEFIRKNSGCPAVTKIPPPESSCLQPGLYLKAFCDGLDSVLDPYRKSLLDIEQSVLADPHLTVAFVQSSLDEYRHMFPFLVSILEQISSQNAHGCHILDILHKNSSHGLPIVKAALQQIIFTCHGVLYKQLASWMLHGLLLDKHEEFFIQMIPSTAPKQEIQAEEDELGLSGLSGKMLQQMLQIDKGIGVMPTNEQFCIRGELLPCYIPVRVAEKILFVGESVQLFLSERRVTTMKKAGSSILKNKEVVFAKQLHELSRESEFSLREFEECIDRIRTCVAEHLWKLVVEESNLFEQLKILKDFLLLGRGELFLAFIDQAKHLLKMPPTSTTQHDVNVAFNQAAHNVLLDDDDLLQKFQMIVDVKAAPPKKQIKPDITSEISQFGPPTAETGWSSLRLDYNVEWPLHILFTPGVLDKYNTLFRFLLAVKRVQLALQQCWSLQMQEKRSKSSDQSAAKWLLRTHMAFLVDNLQYYLQVDVIESQYSVLLEKIQATRDFEAIRLSHDQFITALLAQSFQLMKPVSNCLNEILENCHNFALLVTQGDNAGPEWEIEQLEVIAKSFQRQSSLLFRILSSVRSHQASPHLAQLLLRIDFNKYFSMSGGQLGSYGPTSRR
ncbi:gamma-tubulin complex component 4-like [Lineus longissimus]|uniref:gamma-tubulin complex component 4-like n=1 Tax=Lineus longissimus TaxID=88925 RepID=UPI002B4F7862